MKKCFIEINNLPTYPLDKYIVVRGDHAEFWFYGTYPDKDKALEVAFEVDGFIAEVE